MLGSAYFMSFISIRLHLNKNHLFLIGMVQSAVYLGIYFGSMVVEKIVSRIRHIQGYAFFAAFYIASILFQGVFLHPYVWIVFRFITGFSLVSLWLIVESWVLMVSPEDKRGKFIGFYFIVLNVSQAIAQFFLDIVPVQSFLPFLFTGICLAISIVPISFSKCQLPVGKEVQKQNFQNFIKRAPLGLITCLLGGAISGSLFAFMPIYAKIQQFPVSLVMFSLIFGGVVFQWPVGHLSDIFSRRIILFAVSVISIVICLSIMHISSPIYAIILLFFLGALVFKVYPLGIGLICGNISKYNFIAVTCKVLMLYGIGAILGNLLVSICISIWSSNGLFMFLIGLFILQLLFILIFFQKERPRRKKEVHYPDTMTPYFE